jgi:putative transposase
MSTRTLSFSVGEFYHVYNRGNDSRSIFLDDADRDRFIKLLYVANGAKPFVFRDFPIGVPYVNFDRGEPIVAIGAYCLMANHFHLLLKEIGEDGISKFIGRVFTSYSSYFNKKYGRTGKLFEGVFKAKHLDTDEYLKYIFSYIHLNPVKIIDPNWKENGVFDRDKAKQYLEGYKYSSYLDYIGGIRIENAILNKAEFPEYFANFKEFDVFIDEWLSFGEYKI